MADIEHSAITDPEIHEPKGVSAATSGFAYIADGAGSGTWTLVPASGSRTTDEVVFVGSSLVNQLPVSLDVPIQVSFGTPVNLTGDITLDGTGTFTVVNAGTYSFLMNNTYGRSASVSTAELNIRVLINASQIGGSGNTWLATSDERITKTTAFTLNLSAADVVIIEINRDGNGTNDGGLYTNIPTLVDWAQIPSASLACYKTVI
tara:strand:- start:1057 stop:1671 length:615 start_codon:yes stop_codon:yes gene_type:complete